MKGFVNINDKNIFYQFIHEEYRKPFTPLIIFLHEGLGSIRQWKDFPDRLCEELKYPGLLYDRFGYGRSDASSEPRQKDYLHREANDYLPALINKLGVQNSLILVGHSDGGSIALLFASRFPEQLKAVITIAAHIFVEDCTVNGVQKMKDIYPESKLKESLFKYHGEKSDQVFSEWADMWTSPTFREWNILLETERISTPLLCIQGTDDEYGSEEQLNRIRAAIRGKCITMMITACGHAPHLTHTDLVIKKTTLFLESISQH